MSVLLARLVAGRQGARIATWDGENRYAITVKPLRGKRRALVRVTSSAYQGIGDPRWSPDGRWVAYRDTEDNYARNGLWVVRPNGTGRHRVFLEPRAFAWSPDGKRLAVGSGRTDVFIVGVDGRQLGRLRLDLGVGGVRWSPDGDQLLLAGQRGNDATQIWVVRTNGDGLHRVTSAGGKGLVGSTRMASVHPSLRFRPVSELLTPGRSRPAPASAAPPRTARMWRSS